MARSWPRRLLVLADAVGLLAAFVLGWGVLVEPRVVDVERPTAAVPGLPEQWEGRKVAFLSDFQVGIEHANESTVARMVERLVDDPPALALLGGDFVYGPDPRLPQQVDRVVALVAPLPRAGIPTYAVLGNHDVESGAADRLRRRLIEVGIVVLDDEAVPLALPGEEPSAGALHLVGLGPAEGSGDQPRQALDAVPGGAPRLVFMHNPRSFTRLPAGAAPVAVAGHTHGGQLQVPLLGWSFLSVVGSSLPVEGWADDYGAPGNQLYVSRGIGMSIVAMRFACPPELTMLTLASP